MKWQPIETVPLSESFSKEPIKVLCYWPQDGRIEIAYARGKTFEGRPLLRLELDYLDFSSSYYVQEDYMPSMWMPLPEPPNAP